MKIAVVALGGNALIRRGERGTVGQQLRHIRESVAQIPTLLYRGYSVLVTHGNGPVVGQLLLRNEAAREIVPPVPLDICDADSEGSIGYLLQQSLGNELRGDRQVVSLVTQVLVDRDDPAFERPDKPVGPFYDEKEAAGLRRGKGWTLFEDAGRGYRRVVPSPVPLQVVEEKTIRLLLEEGVIVIAAGGGGIPVVRNEKGELAGVEAVVDKDRASSLLGARLGAELLVILTAEEAVYRNYGRPDRQALSLLGVCVARDLLAAGEFPPGSMGPKIEAAVEFLEAGGREVLVTLPERLADALAGNCGTRIVP